MLAIVSEDADKTFPIFYCPSKTKENEKIGGRQKSFGIRYVYFRLIVSILRRPKEKQRIKRDDENVSLFCPILDRLIPFSHSKITWTKMSHLFDFKREVHLFLPPPKKEFTFFRNFLNLIQATLFCTFFRAFFQLRTSAHSFFCQSSKVRTSLFMHFLISF